MKTDQPPMAAGSPAWETAFGNTLPELCGAIEAAIAFLKDRGIDGDAIYAANIIIEEIGTNIIKYAHHDGRPHPIILRLSIEHGGLNIVLEDDGREFNPLRAAAPDLDAPIEKREIGGLGIALVRQFASALQYDRIHARNRLTALVRLD